MQFTIRRAVVAALLGATATACSTGPTAAGPASAEGVVLAIFPSAIVIEAGQRVQLVPNLTGADASPIGAEGVSLTWVSSNPEVAYVSPSGLLSGRAPGITSITLHVQAHCGEHTAVAGVKVSTATDPVDQGPAPEGGR